MKIKMKVHLYQVQSDSATANFETLIEAANAQPLEARSKTVGAHAMRLEAVARPQSDSNTTPYWLLDFVNLRFDNGPGKLSKATAIEDIQLTDDEGFGEETSALYDTTTKHLLVQYNHHGPRAHSIRAYLESFGPGDEVTWSLAPRLDSTAEARLASNKIIKKVEMKVATLQPTKEIRAANVGLGAMMDLRAAVGGETIEITISGGTHALKAEKARGLVEVLQKVMRGLLGDNENAVETLKVHMKADDGAPMDVIDLLTPKITQEIDGLVRGPGLRYTRESRWAGLCRARVGWKTELGK